jgi:myo-inositol-1-phosphate synthase
MSTVRIAIVGVGNCASSLVQGLTYYEDADPADRVPGLMHVDLGGYHVRDVEVVAAFDVDAAKVGRDVAEAIFTEPNNTIRFSDVPPLGVRVARGRTLDGLGTFYREIVTESDEPEATSSGCSVTWRQTCSSATCPSVPRKPIASTPSARSTLASGS